jgi:hypothetical protein
MSIPNQISPFVQDHQNSSSKYTIVDNCWDAGHCGNITKLPPKKKSPESQNCDEQFSFRKNKKKWQKLGVQNSFYERKICDRIYLFVQNFRRNKEKKRLLLLLVNFVLLETLRFALTDISNPDSFPPAAAASSSSSSSSSASSS